MFILTALAAAALAVPTTLTHQGRLLDADGRPVEGIHAFDFALFEGPVGGAPVWTESADLSLSQGLYTTDLGTVSPLDSRVFDGRTLYLQVTIDGGAPMLPRHVVSSVPYAQRAAAVDFDGIEGLPAGLADGDDDSGFTLEVEPMSGNVTIDRELRDWDDNIRLLPERGPELES